MKIKNYTSGMPIDRTVSKIERLLVSAGASDILKNYTDEQLTGISFQIKIEGKLVPFKLPAKVDACFNAMWGEVKRPRKETEKKLKNQAERTAWKIVCDWVEVQISMIKLNQAEIMEIFLPYIWIPKFNQTFYGQLKENNFKQLESGKK